MKSYLKKTLLLTILVLSLLCLLSACAEKDALEALEEKGYVCKVTIDFCGGISGGNEKQLYYTQKDSLLFAPGTEKTDTSVPVLSGYHVKEYYVKETAEDGTVTERAWDFDNDRVNGDLTLYCRWAKDYSIKIFYGEEFSMSAEVTVPDDNATVSKFSDPKWSGHTLVGYYYDKEYTAPVSFPYTHAKNDENPAETVYAKFIEGNYKVVSKPSDLKTVSAGAKYYLVNDIDMSGVASASFPDTFSGQIIGNGYKIINLSVEKRQTKTGIYYGLFNRLAKGAVLKDVTFENLQVRVTLDNEQNKMLLHLGALAGACDEEVMLENVALSGMLTYDCKGRDDLDGKIENAGNVFGEASDAKKAAVSSTATVEEYTEDKN